jgi:uncharacterized protein YkwD
MKASLILASSGALLAMAGPINKRAMETEWVMEIVTVTVTGGAEPPAPTEPVFVEPPAPEPTSEVPDVVEAPIDVPTQEPEPPAPEPTQEPEPQQPEPQEPAPQEPAPQEPAPQEPQPGTDYKSTMLYHHNLHRTNHSAPALEWDDTLAKYADNTARGCVFEHDMNQGGGGYGQNLASWGSSGDISSKQIEIGAGGVTNQWYNGEVNAWSFYGDDNPAPGSDLHAWGHFTQVVWKSTTKLGCATVECPAGSVLGLPSWYTVCNYNPPGNFGGEYGNNVLEPLGKATVTI